VRSLPLAFLDSRSYRAVAAAAAVALLLALGVLRHEPGALRGDEATFVAMAASLVRDGDLRFEAADETWARARPDRPAALILEQTSRGIAYSKPVLYPLLAAPFVAGLGAAGLWVLNALAVGAALALAAAALARRGGGERAGETVLLFLVASPVAVYLVWRMTESLQLALATAGLALSLGAELGPTPPGSGRLGRLLDARGAPFAGAALLGLLVGLREPNAAIAAVPVLAALLARRFRRAAALAAIAALAYGAVVAVTFALTGAANPYKALRSTFTGETGYPLPGANEVSARFDSEFTATSMLGAVPAWKPRQTLYAALYFFVGRHSGLLAYFPAALALLLAALGGTDRAGRSALFGAAAGTLFYLVWWPSNYFGGETVVGNRYLLAAYPCLMFLPRRLPSRRLLLASWLWALALGGSALLSVARTHALDGGSQNHAYAGVFRRLPYESVASNIEGRRDRYWNRDFVRFVDPYARVGPDSFELDAGTPAAELEIATAWDPAELRFLVSADAPRVEVVVSDWLGRERFRLGHDGAAAATGQIVFRPSPAWRIHRFWWPAREAYRVRLVRLRVETPDGRPARARLRYLGRLAVPESGFERELVAAELPAEVTAGARAALGVAVVHRGGWTWNARGTLPVRLGLRLEPAGGGRTIELRAPLPRDVAPGERVDAALAVRWPETPGRYRATLDLVLEDVAWFGDRTGAPLAAGELIVKPPE